MSEMYNWKLFDTKPYRSYENPWETERGEQVRLSLELMQEQTEREGETAEDFQRKLEEQRKETTQVNRGAW